MTNKKEYFEKFRHDLETALIEFARRKNLTIHAGNVTFTDEKTFSIRLDVKDGDLQVVEAKEKANWNANCSDYRLTPNDFGKSFIYKGKTYVVTGLEPGKKCPIKTDKNTFLM